MEKAVQFSETWGLLEDKMTPKEACKIVINFTELESLTKKAEEMEC